MCYRGFEFFVIFLSPFFLFFAASNGRTAPLGSPKYLLYKGLIDGT